MLAPKSVVWLYRGVQACVDLQHEILLSISFMPPLLWFLNGVNPKLLQRVVYIYVCV